jgi:hypothetical protein
MATRTRHSKVGTKLTVDQVKDRASKFGLTPQQIDKLIFHDFGAGKEISVMVYPGHKDTDALKDFLTDDLVKNSLAIPDMSPP